eukprot:229259-Pyramimonas_sp.AAC.1
MRIPDAFGAYWSTHPPPGTRNPMGRRIHARQTQPVPNEGSSLTALWLVRTACRHPRPPSRA